jgi:hypothetical protein
MDASFFNIALQCCDAGDYLAKGVTCAKDGICYGDLRPVGDYLWFSIPARFGWPPKSLIAANFALAVMSVCLSVFALKKLLTAVCNVSAGAISVLTLLIFSSAIHAVFLRPTIFNTLADPPANLLLLGGIWLQMLAHFNANNATRTLQWMLTGACLGLAAWLRAFYLYPVIAGIAIYFLLWFFSRKKLKEELLILLALLPIGTQYLVTHQMFGTYSYLEEKSTKQWTNIHLNAPFIGYDTVFPRDSHFWTPQHCEAKFGILDGLENRKFGDVICVIAERLYFYLGTYETKTYRFTSAKNALNSQYAENIGDHDSQWFRIALEWQGDVALSPRGDKTADKLTVTKSAPEGIGDVIQWIPLPGHTPYTFSVWLWSPVAKTINLNIRRHNGEVRIAAAQITLSPEPTRYSVTGTTLGDDLYDVDIGRTPYRHYATTFGTEVGDSLYAWGAQLEVGEHMTDYIGPALPAPDSIRVWRPVLLVLNCAGLFLCLAAVIRYRNFWLESRTGISILAVFSVAAVESVAIIPEQRFGIGLMIFFWLIATAFILAYMNKWLKKSPALPL